MSPEKQRLIELEKTGEHVFHGTVSDEAVGRFEPRQAYNYIDGVQVPDGMPAVFASSIAEYAVFMAIVNSRNCPKGCRSGVSVNSGPFRKTEIAFTATKETLSQLRDDAHGYVYVFKRADFKKREDGGEEFVSHEHVAPVERVRVSRRDLPEKIEFIEE